MKATVDPMLCIGCEKCVEACPEVFRMAGDLAVAFVDRVPEGKEDACRVAADECPTTAIAVEEP